jgi:deoxyribonuclease-4
MLCATVSAIGGLKKAVDNCIKLGCDGTQIYTTDSRKWTTRVYMQAEAESIKAYAKERKIHLSSHVPFLVNLATSNMVLFNKSIERLKIEIISCNLLGIRELVLHPGNAVDRNFNRGRRQVLKALREVGPLCRKLNVFLLLETMSGLSTQLGASPATLKSLTDPFMREAWLGVCLDTAHIYASGHQFEEYLDAYPLEKIGCLHLNNTEVEFGSHKDRHASIFHGKLPKEFFLSVAKQFRSIPNVLEFTPSDTTGREQIRYLKEGLDAA